jgi:hypothetical protein
MFPVELTHSMLIIFLTIPAHLSSANLVLAPLDGVWQMLSAAKGYIFEPRLLFEPTSISVFEPYQFWQLQKLPLYLSPLRRTQLLTRRSLPSRKRVLTRVKYVTGNMSDQCRAFIHEITQGLLLGR